MPALYFEILRELESPGASLEQIGATIAQDPAMTLKILQLVNSAFFGMRRSLTNPAEAVVLLGLETVKSLVLTIHIFSEMDCRDDAKLQGEKILHHSVATASLAKQIAQFEHQDKVMVEACFTAGLLHDIGRLALVANLPDQYAKALAQSQTEMILLVDAERAVFGVSHAEIGGYLLGLSGLPVALVETAVLHHSPSASMERTFTALTAVHVANVMQQIPSPAPFQNLSPQLDMDYLVEAGVWDRVPIWREAFLQPKST